MVPDHLIDIGYHDITPEQEREIEAREECARRGIDPDEVCADGGVEAWMVSAKELRERHGILPLKRGERRWPYQIEDAGNNRYNVVRLAPTVVAKELRWEEAVALAEALNEENKGR
jgi:hypothetical protein